ncbi:MAG: glycoside hydrolase family 88 protein [Phycisphaeraceae bacterium]|nr:glycoside hydrolase family 88 protein [Phycisphaeraceae bacterium]
MQIDFTLRASDLRHAINRLFNLAAAKVISLNRSWDTSRGTPVFTIEGKYTSRGWTEWTQGFQYGCAILIFDATDDRKFFNLGRQRTIDHMLKHVTHTGVHDHGFNNLSTYGNLLRLLKEKRSPEKNNEWEELVYANAIRASGAVQAARWAGTPPKPESKHSAYSNSLGYIYSFNGPHSLFVDTMRTIRILGRAWQLGHMLMHENDRAANLLKRAVLHGLTTSQYIVFHGDTDHTYDVAGRTSHEAVFNRNDGAFRCRGTQQGYSPFSTWTRGLAWAMLGYAEELEFFKTIPTAKFHAAVGLTKSAVMKVFERCAVETCDHYLNGCSASDGIAYWDDGAPGLAKLGDWLGKPADPFNDYEPVDSSASAIAAQGLIRLGNYLGGTRGKRYLQAGLTVAQTLMSEPYLSTSTKHQGLLLHSVYHRPNGWDHIPRGRKVPCSEASMWGDYHLLELAILIKRMAGGDTYPTFFDRN